MNIKKVRLLVLFLLPFLLYIPARQVASWRPILVGKMPNPSGEISPDGKWYACADAKSERLSIVNLESQKIERQYKMPYGDLPAHYIANYRWTEDSESIAISWVASKFGGANKKMGIYVCNSKGEIRAFEDKSVESSDSDPLQIRFSPDRNTLWLATMLNIRAWDLKSGKLLVQWDEDIKPFTSVTSVNSVSKDGQIFYSTGDDRLAKYDTRTKKRLALQRTLSGVLDGDPEFSPDSSLMVYGVLADRKSEVPYESDRAKYSALQIIETKTGRTLWETNNQSWPQFSPDAQFCLLPFPDRIEMRDGHTGKLLNSLPPLPKETFLMPIPEGNWLYSMDSESNLYRSRLR